MKPGCVLSNAVILEWIVAGHSFLKSLQISEGNAIHQNPALDFSVL